MLKKLNLFLILRPWIVPIILVFYIILLNTCIAYTEDYTILYQEIEHYADNTFMEKLKNTLHKETMSFYCRKNVIPEVVKEKYIFNKENGTLIPPDFLKIDDLFKYTPSKNEKTLWLRLNDYNVTKENKSVDIILHLYNKISQNLMHYNYQDALAERLRIGQILIGDLSFDFWRSPDVEDLADPQSLANLIITHNTFLIQNCSDMFDEELLLSMSSVLTIINSSLLNNVPYDYMLKDNDFYDMIYKKFQYSSIP